MLEYELLSARFLQTAAHLPYGYEVSFADRVRLNADVHEVFLALEGQGH